MKTVIAIILLSASAYGQHLFYGQVRPNYSAHITLYGCYTEYPNVPIYANDYRRFGRYEFYIPESCSFAWLEVRERGRSRGARVFFGLEPAKYRTDFVD